MPKFSAVKFANGHFQAKLAKT